MVVLVLTAHVVGRTTVAAAPGDHRSGVDLEFIILNAFF